MGKRIDRAARFALATAAAYLFFLNAWRSVPLACAAAFAAMALGRIALKRRPRRRRCSRRQAANELLRIAALPDREAEAALGDVLRARYPDETFALAAVLKHPAASLSPSDVLGAWKAGRGAERLVVAATCGCDPAAAAYARTLREPAVAIADRHLLARAIRDSGFLPPDAARPPFSPRRAWRNLVRLAAGHRVRPKEALAAALLLVMFRFTGQPLYLALPLAVLVRFALALPAGRRRSLFE